jgi:hypothetical protein
MFASDTCDNNEDQKEENPGAILVPVEGQKPAEIVPDDVGDNVHQLRTLTPQKDTYPSKRSGIVVIRGTTFTYKKGYQRDDHNPNANEICEF